MGDQENTFGKYRLIAELGHGGMADVYLAVVQGPAGFSKLQVIKQLRPHLADEPDFVRMFLDEARLAARLNHPNVVQTNEVGQEGRRHYLSMEYLDGQSLHRLIHRSNKQRPMPLALHLRIIVDMLAGLHHAHELSDFDGTPLSVVHRDVSPHNVFVTYEGQVKVVDFGIAKAATGSSETKTGVLKGKLTYMAPEQARSGRVDRRADLFSVGVMLWESVTGKRMWQDATEVQILHMLTTGEIPSARHYVPDLPQPLEGILARALAYSPRDRYETAVDFAADLERYMTMTGERASTRDLAEFTSTLFNDKRVEIKALIERQLRGASGPSSMSSPSMSSSSLPQLDALNATGSSTHSHLVPANLTGANAYQQQSAPRMDIPASLAQAEVSGFLSAVPGLTRPESDPYALTNSPVTSTGLPVSGPPKKNGLVLGLGVLVGLAAVAGIAVIAFSGKTDGATANGQPSTSATVAATQPGTSDPAVPAATGVQIRVKPTPTDAKVFIDDGLLKGDPPTARFSKDGASRKVRVEAPGYVTKTEYVSCDQDRTLDFVLEKVGKVSGPMPVATGKGAHKDPDPTPDPTEKPPPSTTKRGKPVRDLDNDDPWAHK